MDACTLGSEDLRSDTILPPSASAAEQSEVDVSRSIILYAISEYGANGRR